MSKEVCEAINFADENIIFDSKYQKHRLKDEIYGVYCSPTRKGGKGECDSSGKIIGAGFIALLKTLDGVDDYEENLKNDRLYEYAILWLSYKVNQYNARYFGVHDIYNMLTGNEWFGEHQHSIKEKISSMKIYFSYLNNLYTLLKKICDTINKCNDPSNNKECIECAKKCVSLYQHFAKNGPTYHEYCNPYRSILSKLKNDYEQFREKYNKDTQNELPNFTLPEELPSCESLWKKRKQESNAENPATEVSEISTLQKNSLPDQLSSVLSGRRENPLSSIEGYRNNSDSIKDKLVDFWNKLKGKEGESPVILRFKQYLRDSLQGLEGGSNGQHNVLTGQNSGLKSVGGIRPNLKGLRGHVKGINGQTQGLKGLKGDIYGQSDGLNGRTYRLPGLKGDIYGQSDGLNGQTQGLNGQEGESPVILRFKQYLRDSLSGLEGGSNWKYSVLNSHSEFENVGGISPKINGLGGYVKKTSDRTQKLKGQKGESLGILRGQSDLRYKLPGLEGDFYDQYGGLNGLMDETGGRTQGLKSQEGGSLDMEYGSPHLKNESKNNSTTLEDNANSPRKITTLFFDNPLGYSKSNLNDVKTQRLHPIFNGNKIIYIVVAFISILIILGISYKYLSLVGVKKLKRKKKMKKIINMCVKNKIKRNLKYIIENNQRGQL
ncbi:CIR protein [Plasmodium chabaudi chabaudi]|uniref:CIR protein n=1 Tax=Plasmodium chabaudi chabaudi TaxID=31271 RepID=A0A1C6WDN3_PLACU|nr:CIR protein [Plasmodium chabaudi chabaudi]